MTPVSKRMDVVEAGDDLRRRTLSHIKRPLDRLIYLASTRDYNTGFYYHDGLASRFSQEVVCEALADCHRQAFRELLLLKPHRSQRQRNPDQQPRQASHPFTTSCFARYAGSISIPNPAPVGTFTTPFASLRSVEVAHV